MLPLKCRYSALIFESPQTLCNHLRNARYSASMFVFSIFLCTIQQSIFTANSRNFSLLFREPQRSFHSRRFPFCFLWKLHHSYAVLAPAAQSWADHANLQWDKCSSRFRPFYLIVVTLRLTYAHTASKSLWNHSYCHKKRLFSQRIIQLSRSWSRQCVANRVIVVTNRFPVSKHQGQLLRLCLCRHACVLLCGDFNATL